MANTITKTVTEVRTWEDLFKLAILRARAGVHVSTLAFIDEELTDYETSKYKVYKCKPFPLIEDQSEYVIHAYDLQKSTKNVGDIVCILFTDYDFRKAIEYDTPQKTTNTSNHNLAFGIILDLANNSSSSSSSGTTSGGTNNDNNNDDTLEEDSNSYTNSKLEAAKNYTDTKFAEYESYTNGKYSDAQDYADGKLTEANGYTDTKFEGYETYVNNTLTTSKSYADSKLTEANGYVDTKFSTYESYANGKYSDAQDYADSKLTEANGYTDTKFSTYKSYADGKSTEAKSYSDNKLTEANGYTDTKLSAAKTYSDSKLTEANGYTDDKLIESKNYADGKLTEANGYTDTKLTESKNYADGKLTEANQYNSGLFETAQSAADSKFQEIQDYFDNQVEGITDNTFYTNYITLKSSDDLLYVTFQLTTKSNLQDYYYNISDADNGEDGYINIYQNKDNFIKWLARNICLNESDEEIEVSISGVYNYIDNFGFGLLDYTGGTYMLTSMTHFYSEYEEEGITLKYGALNVVSIFTSDYDTLQDNENFEIIIKSKKINDLIL